MYVFSESNFKDKRNRLQKNNRDKKINADKIQNLIPCVKIVDPTEEEIYFGIPAFKGTSNLECFNEFPEDIAVVDNKIEIEDDEWEEQATSSKTENTCQALSTLMSAYQSSSDEEIENDLISIPKTCVSETAKNSVCENKIEMKCVNENNDDDSGPESVPIERSNCLYSKEIEIVEDKKLVMNEKPNPKHQKRKHSDDSKTDNQSKKKTRQSVPLNTFQKQLQYYKERPSTLLEKLLEKDIRHERNVILQCINYIIKNDYFKS